MGKRRAKPAFQFPRLSQFRARVGGRSEAWAAWETRAVASIPFYKLPCRALLEVRNAGSERPGAR